MGVFRFEDLDVWKLAKEQCDEIGAIIRRLIWFQRDPPIRDGLNETGVSVVENITEGFEREGRKEFAQFTRIAKGSNGEGRSLLYLAKGRGYFERRGIREVVGSQYPNRQNAALTLCSPVTAVSSRGAFFKETVD